MDGHFATKAGGQTVKLPPLRADGARVTSKAKPGSRELAGWATSPHVPRFGLGRMTLDELADLAPRACPAPAPAWAWGCFRRRGITFADGREDLGGEAVWVQGQCLTGQLRIPSWRPDVTARGGLHACSVEELLELSAVDGGVADAQTVDDVMSWDNPTGFQPYDRWPMSGRLQRVGTHLTHTAPGGAFVEDWRLQPNCGGLLVALRLMFETGIDGLTRPRDGGLLISGDHCLFSLDRHRPLPHEDPVQQQMRQAGDPFAFADMAFDGETSYAVKQPDGSFKVEFSTNPFREGLTVPVMASFAQTSISEVLRQSIGEGADKIVRQWRVDTLLDKVAIGPTTPMDHEAKDWLQREGKSLTRGL
jgi:hypothetical protein